MFVFALLPSILAAIALAGTAPGRRDAGDPGSWCYGLGRGAFDWSLNFTLAAYNSTGPHPNATGAPLVFSLVGILDGIEATVLSVCRACTPPH